MPSPTKLKKKYLYISIFFIKYSQIEEYSNTSSIKKFQGRIKARQKKMQHIARLLDIPGQAGPPSPAYAGSGVYSNRNTGGRMSRENRPLFNTSRGPGFAAPRRESTPSSVQRLSNDNDATTSRNVRRDCESPVRLITEQKRNGNAKSRDSSKNRSRDGSPRMPRPRSEEIPLELIKKTQLTSNDISPKISILPRPQTPRVEQESTSSEPAPTAVAANTKNEETSFIAQQDKKTPRRKGAIETV